MRIKELLAALLFVLALVGRVTAAETNTDATVEKTKPYKLSTCIVSDEKLGEMGKPYVFTYKDQEIKMCCKSCKKDFDKDPAKYMKKLEKAEKDAAKNKPAKD